MLARMTDDAIRERAAARETEALDLLGRLVAEESVEGSPAIGRCLDIVAARLEGVAATIDRLDSTACPPSSPASGTGIPPGG